MSVFWVQGPSKAAFERSYRMIAKMAKIQQQHPGESTLAMVKRWLRDETRHSWLMIVDDVEERRVEAAADLGLYNRFPAQLSLNYQLLVIGWTRSSFSLSNSLHAKEVLPNTYPKIGGTVFLLPQGTSAGPTFSAASLSN
jgi:hypothetical protein